MTSYPPAADKSALSDGRLRDAQITLWNSTALVCQCHLSDRHTYRHLQEDDLCGKNEHESDVFALFPGEFAAKYVDWWHQSLSNG